MIKKMAKLIGVLVIMTSLLFLMGCGSGNQQETTMEETEEYTEISKKEAKSIAKDSLISFFDTCDELYDYDFYKVEVESEGDQYLVKMFTHVSWDFTFIGGKILKQDRMYMCQVDKYTGEISDKSDPNWEKEVD